MAPLVLGIDSSTQSTKALLVDAETGQVLEERRATHPDGTEVDPRAWLRAVDEAAGPLLERADALAVGGQQHGMVLLDEAGEVVRPALLWNDTRSADAATTLIEEMGGPQASVEEIGSLMVASFTASKLRWVRDEEPENAQRAAQVLLPHDFVSLHLAESGTAPFTDRGDASGTGYYSTREEAWKPELVEAALGKNLELPRLPEAPNEVMARTASGAAIAAGTGDNMGAALGLSLGPGDVSVSIGTSGVCAMVSDARPGDASGTVTGFADATGRFLPMTTTINASRILEAGRALLGVSHEEMAELALASEPGARGVTLLPYFDGAHPEPAPCPRDPDRHEQLHHPRGRGPRLRRGAAVLARRRDRRPRGAHRHGRPPHHPDRRRRPLPRRPATRARDLRPRGHDRARRGVRRPRRRPPGRLGARWHRGAAGLGDQRIAGRHGRRDAAGARGVPGAEGAHRGLELRARRRSRGNVPEATWQGVRRPRR